MCVCIYLSVYLYFSFCPLATTGLILKIWLFYFSLQKLKLNILLIWLLPIFHVRSIGLISSNLSFHLQIGILRDTAGTIDNKSFWKISIKKKKIYCVIPHPSPPKKQNKTKEASWKKKSNNLYLEITSFYSVTLGCRDESAELHCIDVKCSWARQSFRVFRD